MNAHTLTPLPNVTTTLTVRVVVPAEVWTTNYGIEDRKEIREDVSRYVQTALTDALSGSLGVEDDRVTVAVRRGR